MRKLLPLALAFAAAGLSAAGLSAAEAVPKTPSTAEEILAAPRRATRKTKLPAEGIYIGSGVYPCGSRLQGTGFCFTYWEPKHPTYDETIDLCAKEQVGNLLQFWCGGNFGCNLARKARERGISSVFLYGTPGISDADTKTFVAEMGDSYLGFDIGECFSMNVNELTPDAYAKGDLQAFADRYMKSAYDYVKKLHDKGVGDVQATSANFGLDYEVAAGVEIPCTEDFPFGDLNLASALSRGLYRQYDLPMWGSHLAHEWYSWIPHTCPYKMKTLETAFRLKYMAGSKMVINESGNWMLQSNLCPDSPMSQMPILRGNPPSCRYGQDDPRSGFTPEVMKAAEKKFAYIDVRSPVAKKYRKIISDFWAFCRENPCPKGQPEATVAIVKGNLDLGSARYMEGFAVAHAYGVAEQNSDWYHGAPEKSWEIALGQLLPRPPMLAPDYNLHFSGTPFGQIDVASFACDNVTAEYLLKNYKALLFAGWNTCSPKQYKVLCDYVKGGGTVLLGICHLSTNKTRAYRSFTLDDLVNKGDFTELCDIRVTGRDHRFFWATGPKPEKNKLGFFARRRFGYMGVPLSKMEYVGKPENYEALAVCDETEKPVVVEVKKGKGRVILLTTWCYPSAVNQDWGCGAQAIQRGMMGELYRYAATCGRGNVWITGGDFENPDADCDWIAFSYFPEGGKICLLNLDYKNARKCVLHWFGEKDFITLAPGEFRLMDAPVLERSEMLNSL